MNSDSTQNGRHFTEESTSISSRTIKRWQVRIFAITWIAYVAYYITRQSFAAAKLGILDDPNASQVLTKEVLGNLDAVYLAAYAVGQFIWGSLADRWGPRVVILGGLMLSAGATLLMGIVPALLLFFPLMVVQGISQASGWGPLCKNISAFFTIAKRGRILGLWSTNYAVGGLIATPMAGWFAYQIFDSWRMAFVSAAVIVMVIVALFFLLQKNVPEDAGLPSIEEQTLHELKEKSIPVANLAATDNDSSEGPEEASRPPNEATEPKRTWTEVLLAPFKDAMVLRLGIAYFLLKPARYAILLWGPIIAAERVHGISNFAAVVLPVTFGVGGLLAPIAVGWVSDKLFQARRIPAAIVALGATALSLVVFIPLTASGSPVALAVLLSVLGFFLYAADSMISAVAAVDFGTAKNAAGSAGFINGCGSVGAILGGLLPGYIGGTALFIGFGAAAVIAMLMLAPSWNRRPAAIA